MEGAEIAERQGGVVARRQLLELGLSPRQARRRLDSGRWQQVYPGVYLTFTGAPTDLARVWAAVLFAGRDAAAGHRTALWLFKALSELPAPLEICVPHRRQVRPVEGIRVYRTQHLESRLHPAALPPRVRLECAALDVADRLDRQEQVLDVVLRVIQQRLTTADRVDRELRQRPRHRWRSLLSDVLEEAADGVSTVLELRYAKDVERAHGLPRGCRNQPENGGPGRRRYHDVRYPGFGLLVEVDGREAHPLTESFRDLRRDNAVALSGDRVLRYGWRDVAGRPCEVAAQVAAVLKAQGWPGRPRRCGPVCSIDGIG